MSFCVTTCQEDEWRCTLQLELLSRKFYMVPSASCRRNAWGRRGFDKRCRVLATATDKVRKLSTSGVSGQNELFLNTAFCLPDDIAQNPRVTLLNDKQNHL